MQSDLFDKKVKEAADHHHPAYDEQAWNRMLKLLDIHLPQQPGNRRRVLFILLFLLLGGGGWLMISQPWKNSNPVTRTVAPVTIPTAENEKEPKDERVIPGRESMVTAEPGSYSTKNIDGPIEKLPPINTNLQLRDEGRSDPLSVALSNNQESKKNKPLAPGKEINNENSGSITQSTKDEKAPNNEPLTKDQSDQVNRPATETKTTGQDNIKREEPVVTATGRTKNTKERSRKVNSFFLSFSAGPDISFAGFNEFGNARLLAGIGAGYTFKDRLTLRSGFYSGRKVYSASPEEYNPPAVFWTYYPYLQKVDANCKVYEIPLTLSYNFARSPKKEWFVSGGVSTYLMKEEQYNYFYKYTPGGPTYNRKISHENENNHFLSILTLSGGYKRNLSKRVFVTAEPFLKLPVSGIGYGKIKLNSGGVMLSVGVRPFNAKNQLPAQR